MNILEIHKGGDGLKRDGQGAAQKCMCGWYWLRSDDHFQDKVDTAVVRSELGGN